MSVKSSTPTPAKPVSVGPYRTVPTWHAAHAAAVGVHRGNASARATVGVLTHLAWRAPGSSVAWHKGTNAAMLSHAKSLGIEVGMPVHQAVALCIAALPKSTATTALGKESVALQPK